MAYSYGRFYSYNRGTWEELQDEAEDRISQNLPIS